MGMKTAPQLDLFGQEISESEVAAALEAPGEIESSQLTEVFCEEPKAISESMGKHPVDLETSPDLVAKMLASLDKVYEKNHHNRATFEQCLDLWWWTLNRYAPGAEEKYMEVVGRMQPEAVRQAPEGFGLLMTHFCFRERYADFLGPVYMELAGRWKQSGLGQYFTPWNVCLCMAQMMLHDHDFVANPAPSILEPALGSGAMLLAIRAVAASKLGRREASHLRFAGQDIDPICVRMAQIQLRLSDDWYMTQFLIASYGELIQAKESK